MDKKDYDLLQDGENWTVLSWHPATKCWQKIATFYGDSWGEYTRIAAQDYINERKKFVQKMSDLILGGVNL